MRSALGLRNSCRPLSDCGERTARPAQGLVDLGLLRKVKPGTGKPVVPASASQGILVCSEAVVAGCCLLGDPQTPCLTNRILLFLGPQAVQILGSQLGKPGRHIMPRTLPSGISSTKDASCSFTFDVLSSPASLSLQSHASLLSSVPQKERSRGLFCIALTRCPSKNDCKWTCLEVKLYMIVTPRKSHSLQQFDGTRVCSVTAHLSPGHH